MPAISLISEGARDTDADTSLGRHVQTNFLMHGMSQFTTEMTFFKTHNITSDYQFVCVV